MTIVRVLLLGLGGLLILGGFAAIAVGGWAGLWGLWLVVCVMLERRRYRSVAAEVGPEPPGPGGGEPLDEPLEARFSQTAERFVDPTTGEAMRVWVDAASGERRYRADR